MHGLVSSKCEEDPIKNVGARVFTTFLPLLVMGNFSGAQGQLTLQCMVRLGLIQNSAHTLWLSSLPAKMKKIQSKMK